MSAINFPFSDFKLSSFTIKKLPLSPLLIDRQTYYYLRKSNFYEKELFDFIFSTFILHSIRYCVKQTSEMVFDNFIVYFKRLFLTVYNNRLVVTTFKAFPVVFTAFRIDKKKKKMANCSSQTLLF